ncbi:Rrf2 family transcriptional regulator [Blautia ammoniilytica]|uniref:Rrf2 family transcriptional regulator n=1 Tax=Blautia ammoniilytica TaxID=2981782 RepID=A0ABT2TYL4_9FIRM|nr:Rrf2 family transcriptional regulator [Blautia ammoniilytica]MCU6767332.1 Rrf2 family transcriptional regulator [Blautia ammoniilytica]SCJ19572.1 Putative HTH-type transcriptional regulator ywnA [uncultured Blautia sp.]
MSRSTAIAASIQTNPAFVRQIMMKLRKAKLISSVTGHAKPILAKLPERITLLDIYKAVEGDKPLLHLDTHTNPECGVGVNIQFALHDYYQEIQEAAEKRMKEINLQDIIDSYYQKAKGFDKI